MVMTGSPRVDHHDEVGPQTSRGNLPLLVGHPAASVIWLNAHGEDRAAGKGPVDGRSCKEKEAKGA